MAFYPLHHLVVPEYRDLMEYHVQAVFALEIPALGTPFLPPVAHPFGTATALAPIEGWHDLIKPPTLIELLSDFQFQRSLLRGGENRPTEI
jgi:hypothetical protein